MAVAQKPLCNECEPRSINSDALYPQYVLRLECLAKAQLNYVRFILRVTAEAETC